MRGKKVNAIQHLQAAAFEIHEVRESVNRSILRPGLGVGHDTSVAMQKVHHDVKFVSSLEVIAEAAGRGSSVCEIQEGWMKRPR